MKTGPSDLPIGGKVARIILFFVNFSLVYFDPRKTYYAQSHKKSKAARWSFTVTRTSAGGRGGDPCLGGMSGTV